MCTAMPPTPVAVQLDLARVQAGTDLDAEVADCRHRARGAAHGRIGPSNIARKPSPAVFTSRPRNLPRFDRILAWCESRSTPHSRSPNAAARSVDPTMSVNRTFTSTRSSSASSSRISFRKCSISTSSRSVSPTKKKWSWPGSSTNLAPGMRSAVLRTHLDRKIEVPGATDRERRHVDRRKDTGSVHIPRSSLQRDRRTRARGPTGVRRARATSCSSVARLGAAPFPQSEPPAYSSVPELLDAVEHRWHHVAIGAADPVVVGHRIEHHLARRPGPGTSRRRALPSGRPRRSPQPPRSPPLRGRRIPSRRGGSHHCLQARVP